MFFQENYRDIDLKIENLKDKIRTVGFFSNENSDWKEIFDLIHEISENFKEFRYPTIGEKSIAWERFYALKEKAYKGKDVFFKSRSRDHFDELWDRLKGLGYSEVEDFIVGLIPIDEIQITKEKIKQRAKELKEVSDYFSHVKQEMIRDHKTTIYERILIIRESHDRFWNEIKDRDSEIRQIRNEKNKAWEEKKEKSRQIKNRIEDNIEQNREKLEKAKNFLEKLESNKSNLKDKIESAHSDSYREKHEQWLNEVEEKIESVEEQISRLEKWIEEGEGKLRNWTD